MPVSIPHPFKKSLSKKSPEMVAAILECVKRLADDPRHPGLRAHRVHGHEGVWEAYVDKGNRVTFHFEDGVVVMRKHCNHTIIDRNP